MLGVTLAFSGAIHFKLPGEFKFFFGSGLRSCFSLFPIRTIRNGYMAYQTRRQGRVRCAAICALHARNCREHDRDRDRDLYKLIYIPGPGSNCSKDK